MLWTESTMGIRSTLGTAYAINRADQSMKKSTFSPNKKETEWAWSIGDGLYILVFRKGGEWVVEKLDITGDNHKGVSLSLTRMQTKHNLPYIFDVNVRSGGTALTVTYRYYDRVDRKAAENNEIYWLVGGYAARSLAIGCIGPTSSGKTTFFSSVQSSTAIKRLHTYFPRAIIRSTVRADLAERPAATPIPAFDGAHFEIDLGDGDPAIEVLLFDTAGEIVNEPGQGLFAGDGYKMDDRLARDRVRRNARLLDFMLIFQSGYSLLEKIPEDWVGKELGDPNELLEELPANMPYAHIITCADELQEELRNGNSLRNDALLRPDSTVFQQCVNVEDIYRHIGIVRSIKGDVDIDGTEGACFLVSSGIPTDSDMVDFSRSTNVELPLAWVLSLLLKGGVQHA